MGVSTVIPPKIFRSISSHSHVRGFNVGCFVMTPIVSSQRHRCVTERVPGAFTSLRPMSATADKSKGRSPKRRSSSYPLAC